MSLSETLLARDRREKCGNGRWNWTALPIFLSRGHAWVRAQVNRNFGEADDYERARRSLSAYLYFGGSDFGERAQLYSEDRCPSA